MRDEINLVAWGPGLYARFARGSRKNKGRGGGGLGSSF